MYVRLYEAPFSVPLLGGFGALGYSDVFTVVSNHLWTGSHGYQLVFQN